MCLLKVSCYILCLLRRLVDFYCTMLSCSVPSCWRIGTLKAGTFIFRARTYWVSLENLSLFQGWATYNTSFTASVSLLHTFCNVCHNISWEMFFCFNWDVAGESDSSPKQKPAPCWQCFECLWSRDDWLLEWLACHWECPRTEAQPTFLFSYQKTRLFPELWNTMGNITSSF